MLLSVKLFLQANVSGYHKIRKIVVLRQSRLMLIFQIVQTCFCCSCKNKNNFKPLCIVVQYIFNGISFRHR